MDRDVAGKQNRAVKILAIIALVLGFAAAATSAYGMIETKPNYESMSADKELDRLGFDLLLDYKGALMNQVIGSAVAGVLAVVCGLIAFKKRKSKIALIGVILGIIGACVGVFVINPNF